MIAPDINVPNSIKKDTLPLKVMKTAVDLKGFLFIGDPHIYSKTPGRRKDVSFFTDFRNQFFFDSSLNSIF